MNKAQTIMFLVLFYKEYSTPLHLTTIKPKKLAAGVSSAQDTTQFIEVETESLH